MLRPCAVSDPATAAGNDTPRGDYPTRAASTNSTPSGRLPKDHPSADQNDCADTDVLGDIGEEGIRRRGPILTTPALARRLYRYVGDTGVSRHIDEVLRAHSGSQPVVSTRKILTLILLAVKERGTYKRTVFCETLAGLDAAVAIGWGLLDPDTGHSLVSYGVVWRQVRRIEEFLAKGATTPSGVHIDLQWMVDRFLAPSVPKWVRSGVTEMTLDGTDYETWARTIDYTPQSEVDAGRIPSDTIIKPNGKIQRTKDPDAGLGYRSATSTRDAGYFNGYFAHLAVAGRAIVEGEPQGDVAPHVLAMVLAPADQEAGPIGYQVAAKAKQIARRLKVVKGDQHYTRKKETFVRPLRRTGWQIVMNQPDGEKESEQKRVGLITAGKHNTPLYIHCGTPLVVWTPKDLRRPPDGLSGTDLQQWYDDRKKYQWVVVHTYPDGRIKFICPQCKGNVRSTAKTRNPNRPNRTKKASDLPITAIADTEYCCDGMITLQVDQLDNYQRNAYGTTDWATDYAYRNPVEGVNGMIKNDGSFDKKSCRAFGLAAPTPRRARRHRHPQPRPHPTNPPGREPRQHHRRPSRTNHPRHHPTRHIHPTHGRSHTHPGTPINQPPPHLPTDGTRPSNKTRPHPAANTTSTHNRPHNQAEQRENRLQHPRNRPNPDQTPQPANSTPHNTRRPLCVAPTGFEPAFPA